MWFWGDGCWRLTGGFLGFRYGLQGEHVLLQEQICTSEDGGLHTVLGTALPSWTRQIVYSFGQRVVLSKRLEKPFARCGSFGEWSLIVAVVEKCVRKGNGRRLHALHT